MELSGRHNLSDQRPHPGAVGDAQRVGLTAVIAGGYAIWRRNHGTDYYYDDGYGEVWYYEETWYGN
ncbi:hypothetical protein KBX06_27325 [Micromonospora sp. C31]|uniref:hypothetical protein n=1 Tax=Micromonospora sp. C31 TaxID=2824876 RepID=UPI001B39317B|nr:hypothetical protein [Micromonospora sp. C31]MBQ1076828.1 hypothetical protein [Micromonospora sp. C31]